MNITTGKTLLAFKIGHEATKKGWSFIYLKEPTLLAQTLRLARVLDNNSQGVICFMEDVDQVTRGDRNSSMQDILNTLDGGDTKNMNVISIFTTNHIELIEPTFLRGKRIGSIVSMGPLDTETAMKFIKHSFSNYDLKEEGLDDVCEDVQKMNIVPAFMAEIVETVKSNMIFDDTNIVKSSYIKASLNSYLNQVKLAAKKDMSKTKEIRLYESMQEVVSDASSKDIENIKSLVEDIHEHTV